MMCPKCNKHAVSFARSMFIFDPRTIRCRNCGAQLRLISKWVRSFWMSVILALVCGIVFSMLNLWIDTTAGWIFLAAFIVAAFTYGFVFWRYAVYQPLTPQS